MAEKQKDNPNKRAYLLGGIAVLLLAAAGYVYFGPKDNPIPEVRQGTGIYYTGPMKSKTAGSNAFGTIDGKLLTEEEAKAAEKKWLEEHPDIANPDKS